MKNLTKDSVVKVNNKQININEVLGPLTRLSSEEMVNFFVEIGITFPRQSRIKALREALNPYVADKDLMYEVLSDEERYRLRWYEGFSEHQLVNLLKNINDDKLFDEYKEQLWLTFLSFMFEQGISETQLNDLFNKANRGRRVPLTARDSLDYNNDINEIFYDEPNTIDGLKPGIFRPILYKCSTLVEIREIGRKYDVNVPRRLKKAELVAIIKDELRDRNDLIPEIEEIIDDMNVISLQRFAINNDIKASIELKKEEIIEYILKNAKQTTQEYFKPAAFSAYEVVEGFEHLEEEEEEEPEVVEEVVEEVIEEPIVEPEPEIAEEPVVEEVALEPVAEEVVEQPVAPPVVEKPPVVVEPEPEPEGLYSNEINVIFPYMAAVKKKSFKKSFDSVEKEKLFKDRAKEEKLKGAIKVRVVGGLDD